MDETTEPRIDLDALWTRQFDNLSRHLIKVDIAGSEGNFFNVERSFFQSVDVIVLEWHKWNVNGETIHALSKKRGLGLVEVLDEDNSTGVAWDRRFDP